MSTLTTVEVAEAAVAVEITGGDSPAVEATLVDAPGVVEVIVPGPQGPRGETGAAGEVGGIIDGGNFALIGAIAAHALLAMVLSC